MRQYDRAVTVLLGSAEIAAFRSDRPADEDRGLDVAFSITRHSRLEPQPSQVTVWGLSEEVRDSISRTVLEAREQAYATAQRVQTSFITVRAGRLDRQLELCYDAITDVPTHERDGADWRTTIQAADGRLPWAYGWVSETRSDRTDPIELARRQQEAAGLDPGQPGATLAQYAPDLVAGGFRGHAGGTAMFGAFADQNQALLDALNVRYRFSRGQIVWFAADEAEIRPAVELEEDVTATRVDPPAAYGYRKVRAMLDPMLEVGRQVFIRRLSGKREGPYRVDEVTYTGGTRQVAWYADLLLRPTSL